MTAVKLFKLLPSREWDEQGLGTAVVAGGSLCVTRGQEQLLSAVLTNGEWKLIDRALISYEPGGGDEFTLSFQSKEAATGLWAQMEAAKSPASRPQPPLGPLTGVLDVAPPPTPSAETAEELAAWAEAVLQASPLQRLRAGSLLIKHETLPAVLDLAEGLEKAGNVGLLGAVHRFLHACFGMASEQLTRALCGVDTLPRVISAMQHPPRGPPRKHREFIDGVSRIDDGSGSESERRAARHACLLQYLRESVVATVVDELPVDPLGQMAQQARLEVCAEALRDDDRVASVVEQAANSRGTDVRAVRMLTECMAALRTATRGRPWKAAACDRLYRSGLFQAIERCVQSDSVHVRREAGELLWHLCLFDVSSLRCFMLEQATFGEPTQLEAVLSLPAVETDEGLQLHWQGTVQLVLATQEQRWRVSARCATPGSIMPIPDRMWDVLYGSDRAAADVLLSPLRYHPRASVGDDPPPPKWAWCRADPARADAAFRICAPILADCISGHGEPAVRWACDRGLPRLVGRYLSGGGLKPLQQLPCLALMAACVRAGDARLHDAVCESGCFAAALPILNSSGMPQAALLSLLESVWSLNCVSLVQHLATRHSAVLQSCEGAAAAVGQRVLSQYERNGGGAAQRARDHDDEDEPAAGPPKRRRM
eukprot:TRINITY_DN23218_c0_g1_i1.p1 TRINITY_DN23218_c0_g1~~TRINITY_DN23218_c0_g1_i1.p1  ORF type:complete len:669 (+),score=208.34 TRINITY_DN23218_c0_g1_i1:47-2008(+)